MKGLALVAVLLCLLAPTASARRVDWREEKTIDTGAVKFRVAKITLTRTSWQVTATIANATGAALRFDTKGNPSASTFVKNQWRGGLALLHDVRVTPPASCCQSPVVWLENTASTLSPAPPRTLEPGKSWTGTFGGRAKLEPGRAYRVGFGSFATNDLTVGAFTFDWITDHSVTLAKPPSGR